MQDQGKRLLLAVVCALGVLLAWQKLFPPKDSPKPGVGSGGDGSAGLAITAAKPVSPVGFSRVEPPGAAPQTFVLAFPKFTATFSSLDGTLSGWQLSDARFGRDSTHGELVPAQAGDFLVGFTKDSTFKVPRHAQWTGTKVSDHQVVFKLATDELEITKTFDVSPEAFAVRLVVAVTPKLAAGKEAHEALALEAFQLQDPKAGTSGGRIQARVWTSSTLRAGTIISTDVKDVIEHPRLEQNIQWTGFEHPFLLVAISPKPVPNGAVDKHTYADDTGLVETDLVFQPAMFKAGDPPLVREVVAFLGPKNLDDLRAADTVAGFPTGFPGALDLGWFGFIAKPLLWLLKVFHSFLGNWGLAIVMLTVVVKLATLYWTTKSMRSMKAMAVLAPQLKVLQEKYKDDKQRLQVETMALYKENGANPLAGCLPMLLQMPIWIALYRMLEYAGELYQQPFIPRWIDDLTAADPYYVLPILLVVVMFGQARLTPQNPDPSQKTQQMLMQYGMPVVFGGMAFVFPSGLTLYMLTNYMLSAGHSVYINKFDPKSMALAAKLKANQLAAMQAKAEAKNAKDANPKKPAGPSAKSDESDDDEAAVAIASKPPVQRAGQKKKKGRR